MDTNENQDEPVGNLGAAEAIAARPGGVVVVNGPREWSRSLLMVGHGDDLLIDSWGGWNLQRDAPASLSGDMVVSPSPPISDRPLPPGSEWVIVLPLSGVIWWVVLLLIGRVMG